MTKSRWLCRLTARVFLPMQVNSRGLPPMRQTSRLLSTLNKQAHCLLFKKSFTSIRTAGAANRRLSTVRPSNGSAQSRRLQIKRLMKSRRFAGFLNGAKSALKIWFATAATGAFHVSVFGACRFPFYIARTAARRLSLPKQST